MVQWRERWECVGFRSVGTQSDKLERVQLDLYFSFLPAIFIIFAFVIEVSYSINVWV